VAIKILDDFKIIPADFEKPKGSCYLKAHCRWLAFCDTKAEAVNLRQKLNKFLKKFEKEST